MLTKEEILVKVQELAPWWQAMHLIDDVYTPGQIDTQCRWDFLKSFLPKNLKGKRVFDLGCNAGFNSIKAKELGADYVLGIDFEHYIKQANFIKELKELDIDFKTDSIYKISVSKKFDITLCLGLLYHLKYPFLALEKISDCTSEMIILETECLVGSQDADKIKFVEHSYRNDGTVWWLFGEECIKGMLRSVGFKFVKSYRFPSDHPIFGDHYSDGLTEEGIKKGGRVVVIGFKKLDLSKFGMLLAEIPDLEDEVDLNNLDIDN